MGEVVVGQVATPTVLEEDATTTIRPRLPPHRYRPCQIRVRSLARAAAPGVTSVERSALVAVEVEEEVVVEEWAFPYLPLTCSVGL